MKVERRITYEMIEYNKNHFIIFIYLLYTRIICAQSIRSIKTFNG